MTALSVNNALPGQPITFGGVASFGQRPLRRLVTVQLIVAAACTAVMVGVFTLIWLPVVDQAVARLPDKAAIRTGSLAWPSTEPDSLAANEFLAITANPSAAAVPGETADLQIELGSDRLRFNSLLGVMEIPYSNDITVPLDRAEAGPWWGARRPFLTAGFGAVIFAGLFISWTALATLYTPLVWLIGYLLDREMGSRRAFKIAAAALLPGAILLTGAILLYGLHQLPLPGLLIFFLLHIAVGWAYVIIAPFRVPKRPVEVDLKQNPFVTPGAAESRSGAASSNPFADPVPESPKTPPEVPSRADSAPSTPDAPK
ncbi:MAG TPA: hypothetical protein VK968_18805 [Roseimicrobium sp.]|nr:hypothetical protein [Roseimicrobium sp.]